MKQAGDRQFLEGLEAACVEKLTIGNRNLTSTMYLPCGYKTMNGNESIRAANAVWSGRPHFLPQGV